MENLYFKCEVCGNYIRIKKELGGPYSDWAYGCAEWSDFDDNVPELSEYKWERSECTPAVGEKRTVLVHKPFDEKIGNEFWLLYEPALLHINGWDGSSEEDIRKCAVVRCIFEKILVSDEYSAWISVAVQKVVFLHELYKYYDEVLSDFPIDTFDEKISKSQYRTIFQNDKWYVTGWSGQGDCGETVWIYTDENGIRHEVMSMVYGIDEEVYYIGNIISQLN